MPNQNDANRHTVLSSRHTHAACSAIRAAASLPKNRMIANDTASPAPDSFRTASSLAEAILFV